MEEKPVTSQMEYEDSILTHLKAVKQSKPSQPDTLMRHMVPELESCDYQKRQVRLWFSGEPWMANGKGTLHGGLLYTAVDSAYFLCLHGFVQPQPVSTVDMEMQYYLPVTLPAKFLVEVGLLSLGRRLCTLEATVFLEKDNKKAAFSTARFMRLEKNKV